MAAPRQEIEVAEVSVIAEQVKVKSLAVVPVVKTALGVQAAALVMPIENAKVVANLSTQAVAPKSA